MRYLTVAADYTRLGLRDDFSGPVKPEELDLPGEICEELRAWNYQYRKVIPLGKQERSKVETAALIGRLDKQGKEIAERVTNALGQQVKVRYYSEGRLQHLMP